MDEYVKLAKDAIKNYILDHKIIKPPIDLPWAMTQKRAGIFVSLHKKTDNSLRGCIGTILPTKINIAKEIIDNAISACSKDPRFLEVSKQELENLKIKVDELDLPESIETLNELDHRKYGLIVKTDDLRCGLLLPNIEGIDSNEKQYRIACQKAGIDPSKDKINLLRFTVTRHK